MRNAENIQQVSQIEGVDWMGFIFTDKSKRYAQAEADFDTQTDKKKVGVFVDSTIEDVLDKTEKYNLDIIQLHGFETVEYCNELKKRTGGSPLVPGAVRGIAIMKAFPVDSDFDFSITEEYEDRVGYFLFDAKGRDAGGNGIQFDWSVLERYEGETPFLLAGGINPDSIDKIKNFNHPKWVGIDVNSGFEVEPGMKRIAALGAFVNSLS